MVVLSPQDALLLTVLLVCVPIQMWLQNQHINGTSVDMRDGKLFALVREVHKSFKKYMSPYYWTTFLSYSWIKNYPDQIIHEYALLAQEELLLNPSMKGECPAVEVFRYKFPEGHFAASVQQRRYRTELVHYRIGEVVQHKSYGVRGVIIGWDEKCLAPDDFIENSYDKENRAIVLEMANYAILIDTRDYPAPLTQYLAQKDIEPVSQSVKIQHPDLDLYFDSFDGTRHVPSKWLAAIYPED